MERKSESVHTMLSLNLSLCIFSSLSEVSGVIELSLELSRAGLLGAPGLFDLQLGKMQGVSYGYNLLFRIFLHLQLFPQQGNF